MGQNTTTAILFILNLIWQIKMDFFVFLCQIFLANILKNFDGIEKLKIWNANEGPMIVFALRHASAAHFKMTE